MASDGPSPLYTWFNAHAVWLAAAFVGLAFVEAVARALKGRPLPNATVALNLGMWLVELVLRTGTGGLRWLAFVAVAALAPVTWTMTWWQWAALYLLVDLLYYARHRLLHETRLGWALHAPHHASVDLSLTSALRLGWVQRTLDDFFYLPLVLLGAPPLAVFIIVELNHASQFWCHTELIGRLPLLDAVLNTPSNHRVHHAQDRVWADANYGSTLMLWDRLLGTYRREPDTSLPLGWERPYAGHNPLVIQFGALREWASALLRPAAPEKRAPCAGRAAPDDARAALDTTPTRRA